MTDVEKVQLLIGAVASAMFTDAEIQAFIDMGGSVYMGAVLALKSAAASLASDLKSEKIGDYAYTKDTAANFLALAANYEKIDASIPVLDWAEFNFTDIEEDEE